MRTLLSCYVAMSVSLYPYGHHGMPCFIAGEGHNLCCASLPWGGCVALVRRRCGGQKRPKPCSGQPDYALRTPVEGGNVLV